MPARARRMERCVCLLSCGQAGKSTIAKRVARLMRAAGLGGWPSCSTRGAASQTRRVSPRSSAGPWRTTCGPSWCSMHWRWRRASVGRTTWSFIATRVANKHHWRSASAVQGGQRAAVHGVGRRSLRYGYVRKPLRHIRMRATRTPPLRLASRGPQGLLWLYRRCYNPVRLHSCLSYRSPVAYETAREMTIAEA